MTRSRPVALLLAALLASLAALVAAAVQAAGELTGDGHRRTIGRGQIRFDGAGPERWAQRYRQERRAAVRLRGLLAARLDRIVYLVRSFECVHRYEGDWGAATGNGYYGGLQFGASEWRRFGGQFAPRADLASPAEQIAAAVHYHAVAGFYPWPSTARRCGLLR